MMVCNTTNTLGGVGLYYWSANSAKWVKVNLPPTSAADSGKTLRSTGSSFVWSFPTPLQALYQDTLKLLSTPKPVTWTLILDTLYSVPVPPFSFVRLIVPVLRSDLCQVGAWGSDNYVMTVRPSNGMLMLINDGSGTNGMGYLRCYRPSA